MDDIKDVPYVVYEHETYRHERIVKSLIIALVISCFLTAFTNMAWLYVFSQYDFETYEVTSDEGNANYVGGNSGDIINGQSESKETD